MKYKHTKARSQVKRSYWLTPKCGTSAARTAGAEHPVAYRSGRPAKCACGKHETLGIKARESKAWRDGGAKAGSTVTIRHVDPESLRSPPTPPPDSRP